MAVTCQRPDGNLLFLHPRRPGRMATGPQHSQANGPASAGWWNRARCERRPNATCLSGGTSSLLFCDRRPASNSTRGCAADASTVRLTPHVRLAGASAGLPPPGFESVGLMAVTCQRPDSNLEFLHPRPQGRVTPAHLECRLPAGSLACQ